MSCELLIGRQETCKDSLGGLRNVYFFNQEPIVTYYLDDSPPLPGNATAIGLQDIIKYVSGVGALYKFELKANENTYIENVLSERSNGTTVFQQSLNIKLKKQDATTHKYLKLLAYGKVRVVVENNNNQFFLMGLKFGAEVSGGTITSGGALQDHNGYTLTLTSEELKPAPFLNCSSENLLIETTDGSGIGVFDFGTQIITDNSLVD
jgi:hypothetical protein